MRASRSGLAETQVPVSKSSLYSSSYIDSNLVPRPPTEAAAATTQHIWENLLVQGQQFSAGPSGGM